MKKTFTVRAKVWLYQGDGPWHFVNIPKKTKEEIDFFFSHVKKGWGSLPVIATIGKTTWKTSIFPDKKSDSYLLPLKTEVRKKGAIKEGNTINFSLKIGD